MSSFVIGDAGRGFLTRAIGLALPRHATYVLATPFNRPDRIVFNAIERRSGDRVEVELSIDLIEMQQAQLITDTCAKLRDMTADYERAWAAVAPPEVWWLT